jgi:hypothetical protein
VEIGPLETGKAAVIRNMIAGEYDHPIHVVALNPSEGWARDVSAHIARAVLDKAASDARSLPVGTRNFLEAQLGHVAVA